MLFVQLTPTRDSTSELLDALRQREVAVFGPSTPGQTRTPNEGNGTPKWNFFFGNLCIQVCIADQHRGSWSSDESRIVEQQKQQHSSSSSTAAAAQQQWWRRRRVTVFGPSTPGQTRTPNEENGTPKRDILSGLSACIADQHCEQ